MSTLFDMAMAGGNPVVISLVRDALDQQALEERFAAQPTGQNQVAPFIRNLTETMVFPEADQQCLRRWQRLLHLLGQVELLL